MARVSRLELVAVVHERLGVVVRRRGVGQAGEHVERRQRAARVEQRARLGGDARAQRLEDRQLAHGDALVGAEHLVLVLLQPGRDEALAAGDGLLAV